jgi:hypothetical protein
MGDLRGVIAVSLSKQIGERVLVIAGGWMNGEPGGLVERQNRVVLVEDLEIDRNVGLLEGRAHENDCLARPHPLAHASACAIAAVGTGPDHLLGASPREARDPVLNELIQALARVLGRNWEREDDRSGIATRWERDPGTSRRP